jgi:riboflavin kinase / FMN adenylyltransferase
VSELARQELRRAAPGRPAAVTVGVFDGVHRGHQHLFSHVIRRARALDLAAGAVTLYPDPVKVLRPSEPLLYLSSLEERLDLMKATGLNFVVPLTFTSEVAELSPEVFVSLLYEELSMRLLIMGPDHAFGRNREGTPERMSLLGDSLGFGVERLPDPLEEHERPVSSTAIRGALAEGDLDAVTEMLGRNYSLRGPVVHGDHRGREIGFPTANIGLAPDRALPAFGVYATWTYLGERRYASATNIGRRPHFGGETTTVETHILDFDEEVYGRILRIDLVARVSPEMSFSTLEELQDKIRSDIHSAREILGR